MIARIIKLLLATVLPTGCALTNLQPVTSSTYQQIPEEKRLHLACEDEQRRLADSEMYRITRSCHPI